MRHALISEVVIYTDGACEPNPGPGGWGAILQYQLPDRIHEIEMSGGHLSTTNNRMELTGVIEALKLLKRPCDVTVYSDSKYVVNSIGEWLGGEPRFGNYGWMVGWKQKGWRRKEGELQNIDLWQEIDELVRIQKSIKMRWIRGHSGHELNERCDILAVEARRLIRNGHMGNRLQPSQPPNILSENESGAGVREHSQGIQ